MKSIETLFVSPPMRPYNGTDAFELLRQNECIEVHNEVIYRFIEELEKNTNFSFCYHKNKHNKNWTTLNKFDQSSG